jgi:hypothetical protein
MICKSFYITSPSIHGGLGSLVSIASALTLTTMWTGTRRRVSILGGSRSELKTLSIRGCLCWHWKTCPFDLTIWGHPVSIERRPPWIRAAGSSLGYITVGRVDSIVRWQYSTSASRVAVSCNEAGPMTRWISRLDSPLLPGRRSPSITSPSPFWIVWQLTLARCCTVCRKPVSVHTSSHPGRRRAEHAV